MSHLRPNGPDGHAKAVKDYTPSEKASALMQIDDAARIRIGNGKPIDRKTASLMVELAEGTEKAESLQQEVIDAATAPAKKN
jgi:hypothetical protein